MLLSAAVPNPAVCHMSDLRLQVLPGFIENQKGTIIFTGESSWPFHLHVLLQM